MPRVGVNGANVTREGVVMPTETNGDAVNNHEFANDGNTIIVARNSGAVPRDLTIVLQGAVDGQPIEPKVHTLAAGAIKGFGTYPTRRYGTTMQVNVDHAEIKLYTLHIDR